MRAFSIYHVYSPPPLLKIKANATGLEDPCNVKPFHILILSNNLQ